MDIYTSNLGSYFHTHIKIENGKKNKTILEIKKLLEFLSLLPQGKIMLEFTAKQCIITSQKSRGVFPLLPSEDFPLPSQPQDKEQVLETAFFEKNLPLVLFAASKDEARPVLTGVNFLTGDNLSMVSTDGFRLSYLKTKKNINIPSIIIPGQFLLEVIGAAKGEKTMKFSYSEKEKMVLFTVKDMEFYSRLIEGEFPSFEKVIPTEVKTSATTDVEELTRSIKMASVFARDFSNIVILHFFKNTISIAPKGEQGEESSSTIEADSAGEEIRVAFNFRFLLDFLGHIPTKKVLIQLLRTDSPAVFKMPGDEDYLHIIMPVRIQE